MRNYINSRLLSLKFAGMVLVSALFVFVPGFFQWISFSLFLMALISLRMYDDLRQDFEKKRIKATSYNYFISLVILLQLICVVSAFLISRYSGLVFLMLFLNNHLLYSLFDSHKVLRHFLPFVKYPLLILLHSVPDPTLHQRMALLVLVMLIFDSLEDPRFPIKGQVIDILVFASAAVLMSLATDYFMALLAGLPVLFYYLFRRSKYLPFLITFITVLIYLVNLYYEK